MNAKKPTQVKNKGKKLLRPRSLVWEHFEQHVAKKLKDRKVACKYYGHPI